MKIISEPRESIQKIWGIAPEIDKDYRCLRFLLKVECDDGLLLLNTVSGQLILLDKDEEIRDFQELPGRISPNLSYLVKYHFLVTLDYEEIKIVKQIRNVLRRFQISRFNGKYSAFSVIPTTACNAKCFYCFESGYPQESMSVATAESVANYLSDHCIEDQEISINWFGGEPMVGSTRIDQICSILSDRGIAFSSTMFTNGSLFDESMVERATQLWKLKRVQITMDGSEKVYNLTKCYTGLKGNPFFIVLNNIGLLLKNNVQVIVRLNLDFHNFDDLSTLIEELTKRFSVFPNFTIYVHELFENEGYEPVNHSDNEWKVIENKRLELDRYIASCGCETGETRIRSSNDLPFLKHISCMADNPNCIMFNPRGELGKCEHHIFKHLVGDINSKPNYINKEGLDYWLNYELRASCETCCLFPFCGIPNVCDGGNGCKSDYSNNRKMFYRSVMKKVYKGSKENII